LTVSSLPTPLAGELEQHHEQVDEVEIERQRARKHRLDKHLYAQRHLVECCFSKL
jgi:hypothetical protein